MKPKRIMAEQGNGNEALWNTQNDRWSRKAKHHMNLKEKEDSLDEFWEKGDLAIFEGEAVEVVIPNGPDSTIGVLIEGKTRMVMKKKLSRQLKNILFL